ncbi:MAG: sulfurtransferase [Xanthobacteraceae bacterium]
MFGSFRLCAAGWRGIGAAIALSIGSAAFAASPPPLLTAQWLSVHLNDPGLVVLDIRSAIDGGGTEAYLRSHIPGAIHSDYDKGGWRVTRNGVPFMLPTPVQLEKLIGELGIDEDSHVVIVPAGVHANDFGSAARVYWTLKVAGHHGVSILDGGFAAWTAAGLRVASGQEPASPTIFTVALDKTALVELEEAQDLQRRGGATFVDARAAGFFAGKEKGQGVQAYGHISGAINVDHTTLYDAASNRLKSKERLAAAFARIPAGPIISYCNTGHWAAINWFVLSELLGRKDVRLYAGSMIEWTADPRRPMASSRTKWDDLMKILGRGS